jgi:hypothetical protein
LKSVPVDNPLPGEDQTLLVPRNAFRVLDLGLDVFNSVRWFDFESDVFASKGFHEYLHSQESDHPVSSDFGLTMSGFTNPLFKRTSPLE